MFNVALDDLTFSRLYKLVHQILSCFVLWDSTIGTEGDYAQGLFPLHKSMEEFFIHLSEHKWTSLRWNRSDSKDGRKNVWKGDLEGP